MTDYQVWPFRPTTYLTLEQAETWWQHCYFPTPADDILSDMPVWVIITGAPGSGKSVALAALARRESDHAFVISYPPDKWPGSPHAWLKNDPSHLAQMMACTAFEMRNYLSQRHEKVADLAEWQREFVRWLLEKTGGERAYYRWAYSLPQNLAEVFRQVGQTNLFPTTNDALDVQGQIDELTILVQTLGFERILFTVDVQHHDGYRYVQPLAELYRLLELAHHPRLALAAAIPLPVLQDGELVRLARGRVSVLHLEWDEIQGQTVADRYLSQALAAKQTMSLTDYAQPPLLSAMSEIIAAEYGEQTPAGWIGLAETLLYLTHGPSFNLPIPLTTSKHLADLRCAYYARHFPLKLDLEAHGVWRGPRFIPLDEQPLSFVQLLYRRQGSPANWDDQDVRHLAGSKTNVHTLAARARRVIEPFPRQPIYLINRRGEGGYRLENIV